MTILLDAILFTKTYWVPVCAGILLARLVYNRYKNGLSDIPGPFLASLTDLWMFSHYLRRKGHQEWKLHEKYNSPLLRIAPNTIAVADAEAVKTIYGWKPIFSKSRLYISQYVTTEDGTVLENVSSTRDEARHSILRRPVAHAYSLGTLVEFEPLVDSTSLVFFKEVEERFARTGKECELSKWVQMYAFDIIGELTFSKRFGFLESGKDLGNMMYHTGKAMDYIGFVGQVPTLDEWLRIKGFGYILRKFRPTGPLMKFTARQIREHAASPDQTRPDFLSRFIKAREKYPDLMTDRRLATYTNTNISAGSDTTAIALREAIFRILTHPGCYGKFMAELKRTLQARAEDVEYSKPITWAESQRMPYFQAVVKECLRVHPALGQVIPRDVPAGGVTLCGKYLPEGTVVGCNAWSVHRDKAVYGEDAHEFVPERWLDADVERVRYLESLSFAFGGGSRVCLGKNIAMLEISKFVPEFFRRFEIALVDPGRYRLFPGWLVLQNGLDVTLKVRDGKEFL
ncbi:cytochrome P450 [Mytilinidion resinicola]|uniref:Cytochrome P450 n=1 Tax=Mytilinidion resinicola TaxID=574789 RepID=A0A6A6Y2Y5_9PEZI|nr:cytochrome P450 [Mytilinidion resinicola]KAF2802374.1 cytochrome P450 [Mytilinidion resinicola]